MGHNTIYKGVSGRGFDCRGIFLLVLVILLCNFSASAQGSSVHEQVIKEIDKTEVIIERARELLREATSISSHTHLKTAIKTQREAWDELRQNHYTQALQLTQLSRKEAVKAMDVARIEQNAATSIRTTIEAVEERRDEVAQRVRMAKNPTAKRIFDQGIKQLNRARQAQKDQRLTQASRLAILAQNLIDRADRLTRGEISTSAAVENSIDRTEALLQQVMSSLTDKGAPQGKINQLRDAERLLLGARDHMAKNRPRQAMMICLQAKQKGLQLLGQINQGQGREYLDETIDDLQSFYLEVAPEIQAAGNQSARQMATDGNKLLRRARKLLKQGKVRKALQHIMASERLIKDAAEAAGVM